MRELFRRWGLWTARRLVRGGLDGVHVAGTTRARGLVDAGPVILAATHVSWWDGLVAVTVSHALGLEWRILMDAERLERHAFFQSFGAVGVDRSSPLATRRGLRELAGFLDRPGRVVWVFPQGRQRAAHLRPLDLRPGVGWLARQSGARVVPVALDYRFREAPHPAAFVHLGHAIGGDTPDLLERLEGALVEGLAAIDTAESPTFHTMLVPRPSSELATRALSWLWTCVVERRLAWTT